MYISSRDGAFIHANASMEKLLGYGRGELAGKPVSAIYDSAADRDEFQSIIERDGVVHDYQLPLRRRNGAILLCQVDAICWRDQGRIGGYHGIVRTKAAIVESFQRYFNRLKEEKRQVREERKNLIHDTAILSRYMSDELIDYIDRTGRNPLSTARRKVTILFFDIRNSTSIAEQLEPEVFASVLNDIFTDIMDLVYGYKGSVNKLIGDGMMATFGCPLATGEDAINAVEAALRIKEYLVTFNDVRPECLKAPLAAGIGIATGEVFAGVIGSVRRQEYTVLGDAVNVASRIESLTKSLPSSILIDDETYREVRHYIPCKPVARGSLRGKTGTVTVYAPCPPPRNRADPAS